MTEIISEFKNSFRPLKGMLPRLGRLAMTLFAILILTVFLAIVGAVTLTILLFRIATRPPASQIELVNHRLDAIELQIRK